MIKYPPPKHLQKRYKSKPRANVPQRQVNVVSVTLIDNTGALWTFDSPAIILENHPSPQLQIQTSSGWHGASNIGATDDPNTIACDYESGDLESGQSYLVETTPANIAFDGASLALPQSGLVE